MGVSSSICSIAIQTLMLSLFSSSSLTSLGFGMMPSMRSRTIPFPPSPFLILYFSLLIPFSSHHLNSLVNHRNGFVQIMDMLNMSSKNWDFRPEYGEANQKALVLAPSIFFSSFSSLLLSSSFLRVFPLPLLVHVPWSVSSHLNCEFQFPLQSAYGLCEGVLQVEDYQQGMSPPPLLPSLPPSSLPLDQKHTQG